MHLSDEQILELGVEENQHLKNCAECREKADNLYKIRDRLARINEHKPLPQIWERISRSCEQINFEKKLKKANARDKFWKLGSFVMAASILIVVFIQGNIPGNKDDDNVFFKDQIVQLIEENKSLQKQIYSTNISKVSLKTLQTEITILDKALQQGYLLQLTDAEKYQLWMQRKIILERSLLANRKSEFLRI